MNNATGRNESSAAGGVARAAKLHPSRRSEIARKAALTRWSGHPKVEGMVRMRIPRSMVDEVRDLIATRRAGLPGGRSILDFLREGRKWQEFDRPS